MNCTLYVGAREMNTHALIVTQSLATILPQTIDALKTEPFNKVIIVSGRKDQKPTWCDELVFEDGKLGHARNVGVDTACKHDAKYVCMVDSDIVLLPGYIEKILPYFEDEQVVAVGGALTSLERAVGARLEEVLLKGYCKFHSDLPCGATVYRVDPLHEERFNDNLSGGEDHELHKRLKRKGYKLKYVESIKVQHKFRTSIKFLLLSGVRSGTFKHSRFLPLLFRTLIAFPRGVVYAWESRNEGWITLLLPFYYTLRWIIMLLAKIGFLRDRFERAITT